MIEWKNIYRGICIGMTGLVPGISGGTIAMVLGIYEHLLHAISDIFSKKWKKSLGFLIPLGIGMVIALLILSRFIGFLLEQYPKQIQFLFLGLIIGAIPLLWKEADAKKEFKGNHMAVMFMMAILIGSLAFLQLEETNNVINQITFMSGVGLFVAGWIMSATMLLPGLSGSFVLLFMGVYPTAIYALSTMNIPLIAIIGSGAMVGFIASSKGIRFLLKNHARMTYAGSIGMVIGSIIVVFPGISQNIWGIISCLITFIIGFMAVMMLGKKK